MVQTRRDMLARSASVAAALAGLGLLPQAAQAASNPSSAMMTASSSTTRQTRHGVRSSACVSRRRGNS